MVFSNSVIETYFTAQALDFQNNLAMFLNENPVFALVIRLIYATVMMGLIIGISPANKGFFFIKKRQFTVQNVLTTMLCFLFGMAILNPNSNIDISRYNSEISTSNSDALNSRYKVSFPFKLIVAPIENLSRALTKWIRDTHKDKVSEEQVKAVFLSAASVVDDAETLRHLDKYSDKCLIPALKGKVREPNEINKFFSMINPFPDSECESIRRDAEESLDIYVSKFSGTFANIFTSSANIFTPSRVKSAAKASSLANYYSQKWGEGDLIHGVAEHKAIYYAYWKENGSIDYLKKLSHGNGVVGDQNLDEAQGGFSAFIQSNLELSEKMKRAPLLKGYMKMFLIIAFPFLSLFLIAGRWQVLVAWGSLYASICFWEPLWTFLFYNRQALRDVVEMYLGSENFPHYSTITTFGAHMLAKKMNYHYTVYAQMMLWVGPSLTLMVGGAFALPAFKALENNTNRSMNNVVGNTMSAISPLRGGGIATAMEVGNSIKGSALKSMGGSNTNKFGVRNYMNGASKKNIASVIKNLRG